VTGYRAGLSVPDWPNSFGTNMFLYPLSKMTGGIYYEHAHRLYGTLVGLGTLLLAIHLWRSDERKWLKWLAVIAVIAVVVQGAMGGFRVTLAEMRAEGIEISSLSDETPISVTLAVAHGVFGQLFLGLLVIIALACTTTWRQASPVKHPATSTDRPLAVTLLVTLVLQLLLGAMTRQLLDEYLSVLLLHVAFAGVATIVAMAAGLRAWGLYENVPTMQRTGVVILVLLAAQLVAGLAALIAVGYFSSELEPSSADALITTLHQAIGAALLAVSVAHVAWTRRLLEPDEQPAPATQAEPAT
jgi:cytochrome c oxidase assembly protein subunit 15